MCRTSESQSSHTQCSYSDSHPQAEALSKPVLPGSRSDLNLENVLSVFLIDWDDTLFPTTALSYCGPKHLCEVLKTIDTIVAKLLKDALAVPRSRVVILTNAKKSWVHHSAEQFLPQVNALLNAEDNQILVMSAHKDRAQLPEQGSEAYIVAIQKSKSEAVKPLSRALLQCAREWQTESLQIIAVGDQPHDLAAAHALNSLMCTEDSFVKTVLMKRMPTGAELAKELATLGRSLEKLVPVARSFHQSMQPAPLPVPCALEGSVAPAATEAIAGIPTPTKNVTVAAR